MKIKATTILAGLCLLQSAMGLIYAQTWQNLITNIENRQVTTLNGMWKYIVDPYESGYYDYRRQVRDQQSWQNTAEALYLAHKPAHKGERVEYDFDKSDNIIVPGDWNSQKEKLFYYEGTVWYYKKFVFTLTPGLPRQFFYFGAANYESDVYLNGKKLGKHIGGFTPFNFEATGLLKEGENFIVVKVDNARGLEKVPTVNTDWWNYGGLTRDVLLVEVPETYIKDYYIQLAKGNSELIEIHVELDGPAKVGQVVTVNIPDAKLTFTGVSDENGVVRGSIKARKLQYWNPGKPFLYDVNLSYNGHTLKDRIGFRTIAVKGRDILVNGKPVFLRGISIHEENPLRGGRAYSAEDARILLGWAKELGCNYVRLAHYPHNENMVRLADELGILVWSEVPVYWTIQWENQETYNNAENQLLEMITRDKNRASVIIWSIANETPVSPARTGFLKRMISTTREADPVRLVSAALERHEKPGSRNVQIIEDPIQDYVDVISFNQYLGWYSGTPAQIMDNEYEINYDKPVIISELGGGALQGFHGEKDEIWTEEYQEWLYEETVRMIDRIPQLRGVTPWILADFRSPRRLLPDIQDGWNRKGLISQTGNKKKAFYVLKKYYEQKAKEYGE